MAYAGIDRLAYPGDDFMAGLMQNTNLLWTGFYLAPSPSQSNVSWMSKLSTLRSQGPGWGIAPIFVGQQASGGPGAHTLTAEQGTKDGRRAAELADQAGFGAEDLPGNAVVYLDVEIGGQLTSAHMDYVNAWCELIRSAESSYLPGVYCSFSHTADQIAADNPDAVFWVFNINKYLHHHDEALVSQTEFLVPDVAGDSGYPNAAAWQWIQGYESITTTLPSGSTQKLPTWDLDVSLVPDPSRPNRTFDGDTSTWGA